MLARLAVRSGRSKDLEIIVLRHQLTVLRRRVDRPAISDDDRTLLSRGVDRHARDIAALAPLAKLEVTNRVHIAILVHDAQS
jgi:hypothetical protein